MENPAFTPAATLGSVPCMSIDRADLIAIVEAAYDLTADDATWLDTLTELVSPVIDRGLGVLSYRYQYADTPRIDVLSASTTTAAEAREGLREYQEALANPEHPLHGAFVHAVAFYRADRQQSLLLSEMRFNFPAHIADMGSPGVGDLLYLRADAVDHSTSTVFAAALPETGRLSSAERDLLHRLGAHVKTAARLRRQIHQSRQTETGVLDPLGKVLHAEGDARGAIEELSNGALRIEASRGRRSGRHLEALEAWEGLIDGRWSLVERIDTDGKRLLVVHENPVGLKDPRGLTAMERSVVGLAIQGHGDKSIAYHLGLAGGTVSSHLARAMTKLRVRNRVELVRLLAGRPGQPATS